MKPETQRQNIVSPKASLALRTAIEKQRGAAHRYVPIDPAQYCVFADDEDNWKCERCMRRIDKSLTNGQKPYVICTIPPDGPPKDGHAILPVKEFSGETGVPVKRNHRTAPVFGVGFELKKIFKRMQIELPPACVCNSRVSLLNDIGIDETEKIRDKVLLWFEEEASKRALSYDEEKANKIFKIAVRRARKAALRHIRKNAAQANG
jgi:hypothetical protein